MPASPDRAKAPAQVPTVPLFLIPKVIQEQIKKKGESVFSIFVERRLHHQYRVRVLGLCHRCRDGDDDKVCLFDPGRIGGSLDPVARCGIQLVNFLPVAAVPDGADMFGEVLRQGQSDIPEADDADGFVQDSSRCQETDSKYNWIILFIFNNRKIYRN